MGARHLARQWDLIFTIEDPEDFSEDFKYLDMYSSRIPIQILKEVTGKTR